MLRYTETSQEIVHTQCLNEITWWIHFQVPTQSPIRLTQQKYLKAEKTKEGELEISHAIGNLWKNQMGPSLFQPYKSPGPDGINPILLQNV